MTLPPSPARPYSRRGLYFPFVALAVGIVLWSVFWVYAQRRTRAEVEGWLALERQAGREWRCPDLAVGGYPFRIALTCPSPSFVGSAPDASGAATPVAGSLGALRAEAYIYRPSVIVAELTGPLVIATAALPGVSEARLDWRALDIRLQGAPDAEQQVSLVAVAPSVAAGPAGGHAERIELHLRRSPAPVQAGFDLVAEAKGVAAPGLDALLGTGDPFSLELQAQADHAPAVGAANLPALLDAWRAGGGALRVVLLRAAKGASALEAKGDLTLDELRRPRGRLDATLTGAEPLLARFGLGGGKLKIGGVLGALFGGKSGQGGAPDALRLPLTLDGGRASLGPFPLPLKIGPLY